MRIFILIILGMFLLNGNIYAEQIIIAKKVTQPPIIDGKGRDEIWAQATTYTTYDKVAKVNITLKAIYTDDDIFFLISYPDKDESINHRS